MRVLSFRTQLMIGLGLALLMGATRGYHVPPLDHLPSASWAVFFLAGVYLRSRWALPAFLAEAALLDYAAITWGGVSSFCVSPAYGFLVFAYGTLWSAGHWYGHRHRDTTATLIPLTMSVVIGAAVCEVISSGTFYFLSGRFEQTNLVEFAERVARYFPHSLVSLGFYVGIAAILHVSFSALRKVMRPLDRFSTSSY